MIVKSVATSYILVACYDVTFRNIEILSQNPYLKTIIYLIISLILGLFIGKTVSVPWFNQMLRKCHIERTTNDDIWTDIIKPNTTLRIYMNDGTSYAGICHFMETYQMEPIVVLTKYRKMNIDADVILDLSNDQTRYIILNLKDFKKVEIVYSSTKDTK